MFRQTSQQPGEKMMTVHDELSDGVRVDGDRDNVGGFVFVFLYSEFQVIHD